jgi:hypothetical protein
MKKLIFLMLIILSNSTFSAVYQQRAESDSIHDGPYVFYANDTLKAWMIENNLLKEYFITPTNFADVKTNLQLSCDYSDLLKVYSHKADYSQNFKDVDSLIVISDVHGQYLKYLDILIANGVIDKELNWNFGKGHLVFLGDAFDRGDKVTELLWHLFTLEKQALEAGGMVHVLLGNHEDMVFSNDLRYMNTKYKKVEEITKTSYTGLFSESSVLGKWLLNKPVIISINDLLFVHAGISTELVRMKLTVKEVNKLASNKVIGKIIEPGNKDERIELLAGDKGPLWYRGYFKDSTFSEARLDSVLSFYSKNYILVGHTTFKSIKGYFNNKLIGVDAGIGYDGPGEVLFYINNVFYIGSHNGRRSRF